MTGAIIKHIESCQFLEDAKEIVLERTVMTKCDNIKINTMFNGEFVADDKRANKTYRHEKLRTLSNIQSARVVRVARCRAYFNIAGGIPGTR